MKWFVIISFLLVSGCGESDEIEHYQCTSSELDLVDKEFDICQKSSYLDHYCFLAAKKSHCKKIEKDEAK